MCANVPFAFAGIQVQFQVTLFVPVDRFGLQCPHPSLHTFYRQQRHWTHIIKLLNVPILKHKNQINKYKFDYHLCNVSTILLI